MPSLQLLHIAVSSLLFLANVHSAVDLQSLNSLLKAKVSGDSPVVANKDIVDTVMRYVPYAGLSYCPDARVQAMDCKHCQKVPAAFHSFASNPKTTTHSVILLDKQQKEIVVSIRGSESFSKALSLATLDKTTYPYFDSSAKVHSTTLNYLQSIQAELEAKLSNLTASYKGFRLVVVGHSLGGSIASLLAPILFDKLKIKPNRLLMVSYAQPRVGDAGFVTQFKRLAFPYIRVVNGNDGVTHFPARKLGFLHIPNEINLKGNVALQCRNQELEDPKCSTSESAMLSSQHSMVASLIVGSDGC
ncbi:hypothetical protein DSO57_1000681 [Entomophthora muscae]|uniref:Uncharacterized protein n=1 Tax=Entomophthora muscae TaxID=34485 RepID=A0ACC2TXG6_9FUNG|nr:hypothetical protein DSO57_1000681 [Entomophthora muscae]